MNGAFERVEPAHIARFRIPHRRITQRRLDGGLGASRNAGRASRMGIPE
jgi:hypothetical protein